MRTKLRVALRVRSCEGLSDGCRGQVSAMNSSGRRRTSLRGGNRGEIRRGGAGGSVYGDLTSAGCLAVITGVLDREDSVGRETGGHGIATALRWRWRVWLGEPGAWGGLEPSATVAGLGDRHAWRFSKW